MIRHIKKGMSADQAQEAELHVRETVTTIIADVAKRGALYERIVGW